VSAYLDYVNAQGGARPETRADHARRRLRAFAHRAEHEEADRRTQGVRFDRLCRHADQPCRDPGVHEAEARSSPVHWREALRAPFNRYIFTWAPTTTRRQIVEQVLSIGAEHAVFYQMTYGQRSQGHRDRDDTP